MPLAELVPGDVVKLAAGDMIPADVRLLSAKDLFVIQASLTGESLPVEKFDAPRRRRHVAPLELKNICFLGTSVESGTATRRGRRHRPATPTSAAWPARSSAQQAQTSFDKGVSQLHLADDPLHAVMVPLVFLINGLTKGNWKEAFFFALAVAVGLTPEMLPMIVTVCLSQGRHRHVAQEGHRQAPQLHPEPRRDGRALHGQDRHADRWTA